MKPINPTENDIRVMSRSLKEQLVTHNESWEKDQ